MNRNLLFFTLFILMASVTWAAETHYIPLKLKGNKILVDVKIGKDVIPDIMLDTGMPMDGVLIYNPDYSKMLDLSSAYEAQLGGAGSGDDSRALVIESGTFWLENLKCPDQRIIMLQGDLYKGYPTNGIIGYSILGHYITEINYDSYTMTLTDSTAMADSSWTEIPLYFKDNDIPWLDAYVATADEEPVLLSLYIDSADEDNILLLEKASQKFIMPIETKDRYLGTGLSGEIHGKTGKISKLIIGPYELTDITANFAPIEIRSKQENADAVLGGGILKRFNVIFDYAGKRLFLKPNSHFEGKRNEK